MPGQFFTSQQHQTGCYGNDLEAQDLVTQKKSTRPSDAKLIWQYGYDKASVVVIDHHTHKALWSEHLNCDAQGLKCRSVRHSGFRNLVPNSEIEYPYSSNLCQAET